MVKLIDTPAGRMTYADAVKLTGINVMTLRRRVWEKWPVDRLFIVPKSFDRSRSAQSRIGYFATPWGMLTLAQISEKTGLTRGGLQSRMYISRWSLEDTFNTPLWGRRGRNFIMPPAEYRLRVQQVRHANQQRRKISHGVVRRSEALCLS